MSTSCDFLQDTVSSMRLSVASAQEERSKSRASITMVPTLFSNK